jgi:molybdopterin-guanine dinucleotide biosynthesis protein
VSDVGAGSGKDYANLGDPAPPPEIDVSVAHPARIYDFLLGGKDNYAADRAVAEQIMGVNPQTAAAARRNREWVLRAVPVMVGVLGIDQIVDLGTGIPTAPTVHGVARAVNPDVVVAYVDNDPIVLAHDRALLAVDAGVVTVLGDLTEPASVLDDPEIGALIDWSRPVGIIMAAVFHFVPPQRRPLEIVAAYRDRLAPGSAVALSMLTSEGVDDDEIERGKQAYRATQGLTFRSQAGVTDFFAGLDLVEPGVVAPAQWQPTELPRTETDGSELLLVGLGVVRATG